VIAETAILNCDVAQRLTVLLADARPAAGAGGGGGADVVSVAVTAGGGAAGVVRIIVEDRGVLLEGPGPVSPQPATTALSTITDTAQGIEFTGRGYPRAPSAKRGAMSRTASLA
jgi:hypothetical protein